MGASQDFHILEIQRLILWGVFNLGVGLDTKMSPLRVAITKAQEELRLEYDVRKERRRELKFLEKGGNPLDFKFGYAASISLQSTSLTDQLAEHEAKSSFALAASPHGDSVESSGRPGDSMGKEPNIADNLLLFDRENSNPDGKKYIKRTGRRSNATSMELSSQVDDHRNKKDLDNSVIFRLGAKGQAYARRNRSRSNREAHSNKSPTLPSSCDDARDAKESQGGIHEVVHVVSSILNSKLGTSNAKAGEQGATTRTEKLQFVERNATPLEKAANDNATQPSQLIGKDATDSLGFLSALPQAIRNIRDITLDEKENDYGGSDADITNLCDNDMDAKKYVSGHVSEVVGTRNINACSEYISTGCLNAIADANDSSALRVAGSLDGDSKEQVACQGHSIDIREKCQLVDSATRIVRETSLLTNFDNPVVQNKHETIICNRTDDQGEKRYCSNIDSVKDRKSGNFLGDRSQGINNYVVVARSSFGLTHEPSTVSKKVSLTASELQNSEASQLKLAEKAYDDAILKEAWIIEANLKRAGTLSKSYISSEKQYKCHWDFVLEEMSWMANDFMQERLWKATAATQVCRWIASFGRSKFDQRHIFQKQRNIAETLAKAVMQFWHSAKTIHMLGESPNSTSEDWKTDSTLSNFNSLYTGKDQGVENRGRFVQQGIQGYALRFLQYISNMSNVILDEAPSTPDRITVASTMEISSDDQQLSKEFLFYEVPPGAMHSYRESVQSQCTHNKKKANAMNQPDCEAFMCGYVGDGSRGSVFEEDEGETGTDILQGAFEGNFSFKITSKKRKKLQQKLKSQRLYKVGADFSYEPYPDRKYVNHSPSNMSKRPSSTLNVGAVPTKRTRTASRQRIVCSFGQRVTGAPQVTSRTDVSSGDTCSFQDGQTSLHGGSLPWKNLEVESTVDFDRGFPYDCSEISTKPKKKRKSKHLGYKNSLYRPDSAVLIVPGKSDVMIKQFEGQPFESKGNIGFHGQHAAKKSKFSKNIESHEHSTLAGGTMPSPVASQTSYMSNSNKLIRIMNSRGRKSKTMKVAVGQPGFGIPWSTFEDQALVVLVHDMDLNWEFVSDVLNSTLNFKYIYRKPKDCKERHKFLMDRSTGDVADSAEDSSSSQPYPSTLPGIPKGSARQLFQRLQEPMEEDTLKSHFGKIILIGQHLHSCRTQNDNQELKQVTPAHSSHGFALSQAYPNNLSGPILSPLNLCDAVNSSTDVSGLGYQGSHANGITHPGHLGSLAPVLRSSTTKTLLHGSPSMVLGNGLPSPSSVKTPPRDAQRYVVPRSTTLLVDDQQRLQNYNQILPGRNMQQSGMSVPGSSPAGVDRGVRMLHGANGMGMMCGVNRSMSMPRSGFQGVTPSSMLNMVSTNNMPPINSVGMPKPVSLHPSAIPDPGNSTFRPHDSLQMLRPGQSTEEHRQINVQEIQMQVSQGNAQAAANFNDRNAPFSNAMISPPVKTSSVQQNQSHQIPHMPGNPHHPHSQLSNQQSTQQQSYIRFAKERHLQQRLMPQVQHPYSGSTTTSPMQSIPQIQQQSETSPVNSMPSSQPQHKQQPTTVRNPQSNGTISSQSMKQKQRQQVGQQQQPRNVQQQVQAQQQAKQMNSLGREPMLVHQNLPVDGTHVGGLPSAPRNQASEKHVMQQGRAFFSGSGGLNPNLPQPSNQQKLFSGSHTQSSKQVPMMPSHSDNNQASIQVPPSHAVVASQQSVASSMSSANQSPANRHRMTFQQDPYLKTDRRIQSTNELLQVKQIIPGTSVAQRSDPNSPAAVLSSGTHWKQDPSMETSKSAPMAQLAGSPQENHTGNDAAIIPSSHDLVQRQLSGNISVHGHGTGGQWQWQQQQFLRSQPQPPRPPQQQNQHGAQGNLYAWPSNSRPG